MDSDNSIKRFVAILEPFVSDLEEKKKMLSDDKEKLESVSRLLAYTKDNHEMVGIYADQDLITSHLDRLGYTMDDYKASCYLLKTEDNNVKGLPQYEKAQKMISDIIDFFTGHKQELSLEIQELNEVCARKELEKKYYDILDEANPYVEDISEFKSLLDGYGLIADDKINILLGIIKSNISNYKSRNK